MNVAKSDQADERIAPPRMLVVTWNSGEEEIDLNDIETALKSWKEREPLTIVTQEIRTDGKRRVAYEPSFHKTENGFDLVYSDEGCWVDDLEKKFDAEGERGRAKYTLSNGVWKCFWYSDKESSKPFEVDCKVVGGEPRGMATSKRAVRDAKFRANVFGSDPKCVITGEIEDSVLQAAHIHEVAHKGNDRPDNGLVMRADLHCLFDAHILTLSEDGQFTMNPVPKSYEHLFVKGRVGVWIKPPVIADLPSRVDYIKLRNRRRLQGCKM